MQVFKEHNFPKHLYKAGVPNGRYVNTKQELEEATREGFSEMYVPQAWPKWVGPPDDQRTNEHGQVVLISKGGKICHTPAEEQATLAALGLAPTEDNEDESAEVPAIATRRPGRPRTQEQHAAE